MYNYPHWFNLPKINDMSPIWDCYSKLTHTHTPRMPRFNIPFFKNQCNFFCVQLNSIYILLVNFLLVSLFLGFFFINTYTHIWHQHHHHPLSHPLHTYLGYIRFCISNFSNLTYTRSLYLKSPLARNKTFFSTRQRKPNKINVGKFTIFDLK